MKRETPIRSGAGFTLIELLTVLAIILILMGFSIGAFVGVNHAQNRDATKLLMAKLQSGLESYEIDNGRYPASPASGVTSTNPLTRDKEGFEGAHILYLALSGDTDGDGIVDDKIYVSYLEGTSRSKYVRQIGGRYMIVDSFGSPIRFLAEKPLKKDKLTRNNEYDMWSIIHTKPSMAGDVRTRMKYLTNF